MNNTDKLLRAFIEASGYEIETTEDIKRLYHRDDIMANGEPKENAMPETIIKTTDYKVTKKKIKPKRLDAGLVTGPARGIINENI